MEGPIVKSVMWTHCFTLLSSTGCQLLILAGLGKKNEEYLDCLKSTSRSPRWKPGRKKTPMDDAKVWDLPFASLMENSDTEKQELYKMQYCCHIRVSDRPTV